MQSHAKMSRHATGCRRNPLNRTYNHRGTGIVALLWSFWWHECECVHVRVRVSPLGKLWGNSARWLISESKLLKMCATLWEKRYCCWKMLLIQVMADNVFSFGSILHSYVRSFTHIFRAHFPNPENLLVFQLSNIKLDPKNTIFSTNIVVTTIVSLVKGSRTHNLQLICIVSPFVLSLFISRLIFWAANTKRRPNLWENDASCVVLQLRSTFACIQVRN